MVTCTECVEKLQPYLDRELSDDELVAVEQHLEACGHCADAFQFVGSVLRVVGRSCRSTVATEELKARVRVVVRTAMAEQR
jgi:mycothiol system anti-sigma-R factor